MEYICPECKSSRWKTYVKNFKYQCRCCGHMNIVQPESALAEASLDSCLNESDIS